jgi:hypothetical protein
MLALELVEVALDFTELLRETRLFVLECLAAECLTVECFAVDFLAAAVFAGALTTGSLDELAAGFALNSGVAKAAASDVVTRIFSKRFIIRFKPRTSFNCFRLAKISFAQLFSDASLYYAFLEPEFRAPHNKPLILGAWLSSHPRPHISRRVRRSVRSSLYDHNSQIVQY